MSYGTASTGAPEARAAAPMPIAAPPTPAERLKAGVVLVVLLSLAAAFWAVVIHFVATA